MVLVCEQQMDKENDNKGEYDACEYDLDWQWSREGRSIRQVRIIGVTVNAIRTEPNEWNKEQTLNYRRQQKQSEKEWKLKTVVPSWWSRSDKLRISQPS